MKRLFSYTHDKQQDTLCSSVLSRCFLFFIFCFIFVISGYSQNNPKNIIVNYSAINQPLKNVIVGLSKNTKVNISFSDGLIPIDSLVSFSFTKKSVNDILVEILIDTDADVTIIDNDIILTKRVIDTTKQYHLFGYIEDSESGERLMNALVYFPSVNINTVTNDYGYYSLKIPEGKHEISVQYLAYAGFSKYVPMYRDKEYNISLRPLALLNEIIIKNKYDQEIYSSNQGYEVPLEMTHSFLSIGGETNIMKLLGSTAGVSSAADQVSGISVRGGNVSQNLVLMDGVPVYNADHALGIFSIFNNDFLKSVKFYKGAFPSRYSGGLSSVIDVKTKDGNFKKMAGNISIGLFSAKAIVEGPIVNEKASFILSLRRTTIDPWIKRGLNFTNQDSDKQRGGNYFLYDINLKLNYKINSKNRLYFSNYFGKDKFNFETVNKDDESYFGRNDYLFNYNNQLYSFGLNTIWNNSLFSNIIAYSTGYEFESFDSKYNEILDTLAYKWYDARLFKSNLQELAVKIDFDYMGVNNHMIKFGSKVGRSSYKPGLIIEGETSINNKLTAPTEELLDNRLSVYEQQNLNVVSYLEDEFKLYKNLFLNIGINVSSYVFDNKTETSFDPRLSGLYKAGKASFMFGYSRMTQFNHLLSNNGLGLPFNIWIPTTKEMELEKSEIASIGMSYLFNESTKYSLDAYYKRMNNIYSFREGALMGINSNNSWFENLPIGNVEAYGAEFSIMKNIGKSVFDFNYTYSFVNNDFKEINQGRVYKGNYDRRHILNIAVTHKLSKNAEFSATWRVASGNHVTIGTAPYQIFDENGNPKIIINIKELNNEQLPTYHRLDLGFNMYSDFKWGRQKVSLGVINAYNRKNPYYLDLEITGKEKVKYNQFYLIPLLPSITYSISFK